MIKALVTAIINSSLLDVCSMVYLSVINKCLWVTVAFATCCWRSKRWAFLVWVNCRRPKMSISLCMVGALTIIVRQTTPNSQQAIFSAQSLQIMGNVNTFHCAIIAIQDKNLPKALPWQGSGPNGQISWRTHIVEPHNNGCQWTNNQNLLHWVFFSTKENKGINIRRTKLHSWKR